jgi:hypothetical protein
LNIKISRHAKRRAKLYHINESDILIAINETELKSGKHTIIKRVKNLQFPIKIVYFLHDDDLIVITNYPLKREKKP